MRLRSLLLAALLLATLPPVAQAAYDCEYVGLFGLGNVRACDRNLDQVPDRLEFQIPGLGSHGHVQAYQRGYGGDGQTNLEAIASTGQPIAPTGWIKVDLVDDEYDGDQDRIYANAGGDTQLRDGGLAEVVLVVEDRDRDGAYGTPVALACSFATGCLRLL